MNQNGVKISVKINEATSQEVRKTRSITFHSCPK